MITRADLKLNADPNKVILRFFNLSENRTKNVIERVLSLEEEEVRNVLNTAFSEFKHRHRFFEKTLLQHYNKVVKYLSNDNDLTRDRKMLIGSYFSMEYSIEAAALFNPSIVPHPDQSNLEQGNLRFVLSLRAVGEGHISSIEFRDGVIDENGTVTLSNLGNYTTPPTKIIHPDEDIIDKRKLRKHLSSEEANNVLITNYSCEFGSEVPLNEKVLFPYSSNESMGLEDVRLVQFSDYGKNIYYGTYTAYDGKSISPQIIETSDFERYEISTMHGNAIHDKGFALFPRKINDQYVFTSRQDGENLYLMYSDNLYYWNEKSIMRTPKHHWEYMQIGNCGSPIETKKGWLLLTHAVGPFRKYVISVLLLDLKDPSKIIGTLNEPLIEPNDIEREGYVPNVVYSCGALIHNNKLIIPYAMSDSTCGFAKVELDDLLNKITKID